jgi:transposase
MKKRPPRVIGMDVSKGRREIACRPEPTRWHVTNDSTGMGEWRSQLRPLQPTLMGLEATGGWQFAFVAARAVSTRPFAVLNPRQLRDFAKATGALAQTAALDAGVIAHVAEAVRPTPRPLPDETTPPMDARLPRRRPRRELVVAERPRLALAHPAGRASLARHLDDLQRVSREPAEERSTVLRSSPAWRAKEDCWQAAPGMGPVRSAPLHAAGPELGALNQRAIAQLVGVAPLHDESGQRSGARHSRGGRAAVRVVLYLAPLTATRWTPVRNAFDPRWRARGTGQQVARTAAMRTLLSILNTMGTTQTSWNARLKTYA